MSKPRKRCVNDYMDLFQELILISINKRDHFSRSLSGHDWYSLYQEAQKQSMTGFLMSGVERVHEPSEDTPDFMYQWFGEALFLEEENRRASKRAGDLTTLFASLGYRSCVLKGQGVATLYPNPLRRQCGDIDLWVDGARDEIRRAVMSNAKHFGRTVIHHIDAEFFDDVATEIHFLPSYCFDPLRYAKYKRFFNEFKEECFVDNGEGFCNPSRRFNAVYLLLHVFRHVFHEGIGLRQLLDYYYCLSRLTSSERIWAYRILRDMGLGSFCAAVMYVEQKAFELGDEYLLCSPNEKMGEFLYEEIMRVGNFGHYDDESKSAHANGGFQLYGYNVKRLFKMIELCPSEVLWAPLWKPAHWLWCKCKGY